MPIPPASRLYAGYGLVVNAVDVWTASVAFSRWKYAVDAFSVFECRCEAGTLAYNRIEASARALGRFVSTRDLVTEVLRILMSLLRQGVPREFIENKLEGEDDLSHFFDKPPSLCFPPCDAIWEPSGCQRNSDKGCPCAMKSGEDCHCSEWEKCIMNRALNFERRTWFWRPDLDVREMLSWYGLTLISDPGMAAAPCEQRWILGLTTYCDGHGSKPKRTGVGAPLSILYGQSDTVVEEDLDHVEIAEHIEEGVIQVDPACFTITDEERRRFHRIVRDLDLTIHVPNKFLLGTRPHEPNPRTPPAAAEPSFMIIHHCLPMDYNNLQDDFDT